MHETLLEVWREACRHIDIAESTERIARVLASSLPLGSAVVRRLDLQHGCLDSVAVGASHGQPEKLDARTSLTREELQRFSTWAMGRAVIASDGPQSRDLWPLIFPLLRNDHAIAGPLHGSADILGVLVLLAAPDRRFDETHSRFMESLLEPFSVALENDQRLHEMATLREAAEAERRALLVKLGRKELGDPIIGSEQGLRDVLSRVEVVRRSDVPVLLLGETGTGKEVIARAIHTRSPRREGPFIRVNCGAIPSELIDSQLFGHERGSFTGASETHKGWFERADGGTLFLDEIGELPLPAQVRLLRVLQDGYIDRVGGRQSIHVDVRIVAATHRDLAAMVRNGSFREDLWYRIAVFPIPLPPLRDRCEDIPAMACHFAEKAAIRFGLPLVMPTPEDMRLLIGYAWPGNVRELGAVMDRAALLGNGVRLEVAQALGAGSADAMPMRPMAGDAFASVSAMSHATSPSMKSPPPPAVAEGFVTATAPRQAPDTMTPISQVAPAVMPPIAAPAPAALIPDAPSAPLLDDMIRAHIEASLRLSHGRVDGPFGAALRLGINPHTLRARMKKLGIQWKSFRPQTP